MKRHWLLLIALLLTLPRMAAARDLYFYLSEEAFKVEWVVPPPAKHLSPENKSDIDQILSLQTTRTSRDCDRAFAESEINLKSFFSAPYGPLSTDETRRLGALFERIRADAGQYVKKAQTYFERSSPYAENSRVIPCVALEGTDSYPSGHAAIAQVFANILTARDPSRAAAFAARADQIGTDRVMAGVDRPSDIEAGKKLGTEISHVLLEDSRFRKELLLYLRDNSDDEAKDEANSAH